MDTKLAEKASTLRDYHERVNRVIFHIEAELDHCGSLEELSRLACFSPHHFHRIFAALTGEPLMEYIRRLRLERAAQQLKYLDSSITAIGLNAGYETGAAFGRAFNARFGMSPSEYRKLSAVVGIQGSRPLPLDVTQEQCLMKPEFRSIESIPVLFVRRTGAYAQAAEGAFASLCGFAGPRGLLGPGVRVFGISHDDPNVTAADKCRYDACISYSGEAPALEGELRSKALEGGRYAVFRHRGSYEGLNAVYGQIFGRWLPESGQQLRDAPGFEEYLKDPETTPPEELETEIWLPLE
ncbi:MAG: AraC family transcriptional regulator [Myxococcota bacterium]|jgi:AraC family transcriptional regulator|nr:AraC family transcriptional regulator [Myxococcota bacterium]